MDRLLDQLLSRVHPRLHSVLSEYHPAPSEALNNLGAALLTMGREAEAMDYLGQAALADTSMTGPLRNAALQRSSDGDLDEARDLYSR